MDNNKNYKVKRQYQTKEVLNKSYTRTKVIPSKTLQKRKLHIIIFVVR